jgi:hypothetical protein
MAGNKKVGKRKTLKGGKKIGKSKLMLLPAV